MDSYGLTIQRYLENTYDIPFVVQTGKEYNDPYYLIFPKSELEELFSVRIMFRQNIRMIIEIHPQKYAAGMIYDIQHAEMQKRKNFQDYLQLFRQNKAKIELFINKTAVDEKDDSIWSESWTHFSIRATKILQEQENNQIETVITWAELAVGTMLSLLKIEYLEQDDGKYGEGKIDQVLVNKYERNPINRQLCLAVNGYVCKICGFDFEKKYGDIGKGFIHVHHIEMVSSFGGEYYLDPKKDLIPVCPNCHAMLHRKNPPLEPAELRQIIDLNNIKQGDHE